MQATRQQILEALRDQGESTVDHLVVTLRKRRNDNITAVTVRHHLNELIRRDLIETARLLHRNSPGRPQHVYTLTERAQDYFPDNYQELAARLLSQIQSRLPDSEVNVIIESVAKEMADEAGISALPMPARLDQVVSYLNQTGYVAEWKKERSDYLLVTHNCPYHDIAKHSDRICKMDLQFISAMLGVVPRLSRSKNRDENICLFRIPESGI